MGPSLCCEGPPGVRRRGFQGGENVPAYTSWTMSADAVGRWLRHEPQCRVALRVLFKCGPSSIAHIPWLLLMVSAGFCAWPVSSVAEAAYGRALWGIVIALAVTLYSLSLLRWIRVSGDVLSCRSIFGVGSMPVRSLALGVKVRQSRGHNHYTVFAFDGTRELDLADPLTGWGSQRALAKLEGLVAAFTGATGEDALAARLALQQRDAERAAGQAEAQRQVDAYYASGKHRRWGFIILGVFVLAAVAGSVVVLNAS